MGTIGVSSEVCKSDPKSSVLGEEVMAGNNENAHLIIYTREFRIEGYVKLWQIKIVDKTVYPRTISDVINMASERMALAGEPDFLELGEADMKDLKTGEVFDMQKMMSQMMTGIK